jgi:hypothetical protein
MTTTNNKKKQPPCVRDLAQEIIDHVLEIQTNCQPFGSAQGPLVQRHAASIQRLSRQLLLPREPGCWTDGLEELVSRIERGDAPSSHELDRHLVLLDVAAAKIRNFRRSVTSTSKTTPPPCAGDSVQCPLEGRGRGGVSDAVKSATTPTPCPSLQGRGELRKGTIQEAA